MSAADVTSPRTARATWPSCAAWASTASFRSQSTTCPPPATRRSAVAAPSPEAAPVIRKVRSFTCMQGSPGSFFRRRFRFLGGISAQLKTLNLATGGFGQGLNKLNHPGKSVGGETLTHTLANFVGQLIAHFKAFPQYDIGLDHLATNFIGLPHGGGLRDRRVGEYGVLHIGGTDPVACRCDDVVVTPRELEGAILIAHHHIARQIIAIGEGVLLLPGVTGKKVSRRVLDIHRQYTRLPRRQLIVLGIQNRQPIAGHRYPHGTNVLGMP